MKVHHSRLAIFVAALGITATADASVLAYESFNYTAGQNLSGKGPASGFNSAWTVSNGTPPLVQTGNPIDNPDGKFIGGAEWAASANLSSTYGLTDSTYVLSFDESAPVGKLGYFELYQGNSGKLVIGIATDGQFFIETWGAPGSRQYTGAYSSGAWREVVATIDFNTGIDTVNLLVFDQNGTQLGNTVTFASLDFTFDRIRLNAWGGGSGSANWDEIKLEDQQTAQVPEPGSLLLLSLGVVGLFASQRMRRRAA